ncbi:PH domain-containing protein [Neobacillus vireti]|uniref:PH domain-containing protein n=1 Tax=Neobacillus vireti TaxID=220686 RepID=UPI002FFF71F8
MYGDEWTYKEIISIELMDHLPEVTVRTNGVGLPALSKGQFKVTGYGTSLLFIQKGSSPYIYIEMKDRKIFINDKDPEQTQIWYQQLIEKMD